MQIRPKKRPHAWPKNLLFELACLLSLMSVFLLPAAAAAESQSNEDEFPGRRQGGGTHMLSTGSKYHSNPLDF